MVGTCRSSCCAALRIVVPGGTAMGLLSMMSDISGIKIILEYWSGGVMEYWVRTHHSIIPILHHSNLYDWYHLNISGHNFIALNIAVGAVWPRPQRDASIIVEPTSAKRSRSPASESPAAARS